MPPSPSTETEEDPYLKHDPYYVQAVEWLESPSLLYNLQEAISRREAQQDYLVGEEDNAIQLLFDVIQKQSVEVRGESGGGKNTLCDRVLSIVPPEWYRKIGGLTDKSLRYLEPSVRILYIAERRGLGLGDLESTPEYDMKVSISEGELTYLEVVRDKESGEQKTVERTVRVGQFITTSTEPAFAQLENRVDVIQIRDDVAQNEKVRDEQLRKAGTFPWDAKSYDEQVKVAQYCVRMVDRETGGLDVLIPFGDCLKPILRTEATSVRRNGLKILNMVEACAKVHYRQRPRVKSRGQEVIVACPLDLMIVLNIAGRNLEQMLSEATPKMVSVFELAREVDGRKDKITTPTLLALAREKKLSQLGRRSIQDTVRTLTERGILRQVYDEKTDNPVRYDRAFVYRMDAADVKGLTVDTSSIMAQAGGEVEGWYASLGEEVRGQLPPLRSFFSFAPMSTEQGEGAQERTAPSEGAPRPHAPNSDSDDMRARRWIEPPPPPQGLGVISSNPGNELTATSGSAVSIAATPPTAANVASDTMAAEVPVTHGGGVVVGPGVVVQGSGVLSVG